jgi:dipeptidyl aminopeptidase/acylaminoacyl peptidase
VDALEALKVLRAAPGVDPKRTFVLGHSLGTLAAPLVATEAGTFAVSSSSPGRRGRRTRSSAISSRSR